MKQYIDDGDLEQEEAARLISLHKAERKQMLNAIKTMPDSERYYPARRLPKDSNIVARPDALLEFVSLVNNSVLDANFLPVHLGQGSSPRNAYNAVNKGPIIRHFNVKSVRTKTPNGGRELCERIVQRLGCMPGRSRPGGPGSMRRPDLVAAWWIEIIMAGPAKGKGRKSGQLSSHKL